MPNVLPTQPSQLLTHFSIEQVEAEISSIILAIQYYCEINTLLIEKIH